jgi:hypothetical protein
MPYYGSLQVIDRSGWTKSFSLEKALLMVGTASYNDIVLPDEPGSGVAPVHLQVMRPALEVGRIRVVNLASSACALVKAPHSSASAPRSSASTPEAVSLFPDQAGSAPAENIPVAGSASIEMESGDTLILGGFRLVFSLRMLNGIALSTRSENIGIRLEFPNRTLRPGKGLAGQITVINFGSQKRCQFELELEGLPQDCYQIEPAPILFPNSDERLQIRLLHRCTHPAGGLQKIWLHAVAAAAYPTEELTLPFELDIAVVDQVDFA